MADFDINSFINALKNGLFDNMPLEDEEKFNAKHKKRHSRMREIALEQNTIIPIGSDKIYFELGNPQAEKDYPFYHILEQAEVISKRWRGTKGTLGSQASIADLGSRDYGQWTMKTNKNGKTTMFQEYSKNVRGKRSKVGGATRTITDSRGREMKINRESKYYVNKHYHYIENILETFLLDQLANEFNLKRKRTSINDSAEANMIDFNAMLPMVI